MDKISMVSHEFTTLIRLLEQSTGDSFTITETTFGGVWLQGTSMDNELYLKSNYGLSLVVARISFSKKRSGICTQVFEWLETFAQNKGFLTLAIESTTTKEMNAFATKHAYIPITYQGMLMDGEFYGNYEKKLSVSSK